MKGLEKFFLKICKPNPKAFPSDQEASIAFIKNKFIFGVHLTIISVHLSTIPFIEFTSPVNFMRLITQIVMLAVFLTFCRSYPIVGQAINAALINLVGIKLSHFSPDGVYISLIIFFGIPCFVFYLTQNLSLILCGQNISILISPKFQFFVRFLSYTSGTKSEGNSWFSLKNSSELGVSQKYFLKQVNDLLGIQVYEVQNPPLRKLFLAIEGLTAFSSTLQFFMITIHFKARLVEAISFIDPNVFADKFTAGCLTLSIPVQVLNLYMIYNLNKRTDELSKATRKAEEALEQQKTFVYSFSHEMRNPMNSLLGNLDLALMSEQIAPDVREMIGTAKICGVLLLNLINTVLDAGKLGLGKLEVNPVPTRIHDVFQRAWAISHDIITKKGLKSHLKFSRQVPTRLLLDSHRLNQVLMNLIGNATKFTESGLIALSVSWLTRSEVSDESFLPVPYDEEDEGVFEKDYNLYAIKRSSRGEEMKNESLILSGSVKEFSLEGIHQPSIESKGVLKIIIKDTGCGMSPEELSKLFQKFSQVGQVTSKRQIGTGLGLFISKEIVENMGGQIRVYSKSGVGTTFIICIPTTALPSQRQQQLNTSEHLIPKLKSRKFTTIVADDSSFNVSLVCNFYSKVGVEVLATANNGQVAYNKYLESMKNGQHIDIITLDIDMPIMDGKQVCEKIRQYERENNLKRSIIILISGNYEEEEMHNMLSKENDNKADCFLKKPLVFEEFCWALYKYACSTGNSLA